MKNSLRLSLILSGALLSLGQDAARAAEKPAAPASRVDSVLVTLEAKVESIDRAKREVTLKGPLGNMATVTVDQRVKRFDEIKVGDLVRADYYISIAAELRKPTAEEEKSPIQVLDVAGKAPPGTSPAAGGLRRLKVVTTVEGLDRPTETVTVKGPMGNFLTARVADPANLTQFRIGDKIVVTLTEALAISLEKVEPTSVK